MLMPAEILQLMVYITVVCLREIFQYSGLAFPCLVSNLASLAMLTGYLR